MMKNRLFISVFGVFLLLSLSVFGLVGDGTENNPYVLTECYHLNNLSINLSGYYVLGNDLDCSGYAWNNGNVPLCSNFAGSLDGNGFSVFNFSHYGNNQLFGSTPSGELLNISFVNVRYGFNSSSDELQFFSKYPSGFLFQDVHIVNGEHTCGESYCTASYWFAEEMQGNSLIDRCSVSGYMESTSNVASFFLQSSDVISLNNSYSSVHIGIKSGSTPQYVGGLVARWSGIQNSFFNGTIENINVTPANYWGGCCGRISGKTISDVYVSATFINVTFSGYRGLFAGSCSGTFNDNFVDNETGNDSYRGSGCGLAGISLKNVSEMQKQITFSNWDFDNTWLIDEGSDFPKLSWQYPLPRIYNFSVVDPEGYNYSLVNNSVFEYLSGLWTFLYNIDSSSVLNMNMNNISNVSSVIYHNVSSFVHPVYLSSSIVEDANPHSFYVWMNDSFYNSSEILFFSVIDSIIPNCSGLSDFSLVVDDVYNLDVACIDESLDLFNISCGGLYQFYNFSLDSSGFNLSDSFIVDKTTICMYNYCDKFSNCVSGDFTITATEKGVGVSVDLTPLSDTLIKIFLLMFWLSLLVLSLTLKGNKGQTVQFLNIMQMLVGFVAGSIWMRNYFLIGFPLIFISLGFFIGLIMNERR